MTHSPVTFYVVSGLPASGKTTLGQQLASALALRMLDKDSVLEALFSAVGTGDAAWRTALSRASDDALFRAASGLPGAVLVSFWRRETIAPTAGTPTAPLSDLPGELVEVFCRCDPEVAARRFVERARHPGHLDRLVTFDEILPRFQRLAAAYPVGLDKVVTVDTTEPVDIESTLRALASLAGRPG
jgi:hypothetical protein